MSSIRLSFLLVMTVPATARGQEMSLAQRSAVEDTIRLHASRFAERLGPGKLDSFLDLFIADRDFIYVDGGQVYPDRETLGKMASGFFASLKTGGGTWTEQRVIALSPDAGAFTGVFESRVSDTTGQVMWPEGKVWTLVYQRRAGKWLIIQAHEATRPRPR